MLCFFCHECSVVERKYSSRQKTAARYQSTVNGVILFIRWVSNGSRRLLFIEEPEVALGNTLLLPASGNKPACRNLPMYRWLAQI